MADRHRAPKVREDFIFRPLDEEWVVYDPSGQQLHVLNHVAAMVWLSCTGDYSVEEIVDTVQEAFARQIQRNHIERDVVATVDEFAKKGLLE